MKQLPLPIAFEESPRLSDFVLGANAEVLHGLRDLAWPGPPVYLWGPAGVGKTYLLSALVNEVQLAGGRAAWFDARQGLPWEVSPGLALIVLDGAERLDPDHQHAAFTLFIEAAAHGVQMVSAGRMPPVDLPVREDLRTRLGWGPVYAVHPLSEAQMRQVLQRDALRQGLSLPTELLDHLFTHHARDLASLQALVRRLERFSLAEGRAMTVPLLRRMLAEEGP
ncbi:HdaA/DnaA family protein [Ideonella livida]|uniref:DnaA regulatory inactivator Hda n=1 Tax=Ideonella livida TaxID=2707176 RepID=A0A7C9TLN5_9BURK|nr:DnaA/Hda family protein [Ideonella livida]NDY91707.1 DnaA regulatory inactivator Hda [Ideonella livida]